MDYPHEWQLTAREAIQVQKELASQVETDDSLPLTGIHRVAGVDVGFEEGGRITRAAAVLLDFPSLELRDFAITRVKTIMPYIPGLLSFRECPAIMKALSQLRLQPDLIFCDGQGIAHPRRFGVACHLGVLTGLPTVGVAKSRLCGVHNEIEQGRGSQSDLIDKGEIIGRVFRSRDGCRPLYVSIGHRISLDTAISYVQACLKGYRLPETTRWADALASNRGRALVRAEEIIAARQTEI